MKQINNYITEKLHLGKNTGINKEPQIDIDTNNCYFDDDEIDQIIEWAKKLPIVPIYISNRQYNSFSSSMKTYEKSIVLYFSEDYDKKPVHHNKKDAQNVIEIYKEGKLFDYYMAAVCSSILEYGNISTEFYGDLSQTLDLIYNVCEKYNIFTEFKK